MSEHDALAARVEQLVNAFNELLTAQRNTAAVMRDLAKSVDMAAFARVVGEVEREQESKRLRDYYVREVMTRWFTSLDAGATPEPAMVRAAARNAYALANEVLEARAEEA
jgi:cytochrome P450